MLTSVSAYCCRMSQIPAPSSAMFHEEKAFLQRVGSKCFLEKGQRDNRRI